MSATGATGAIAVREAGPGDVAAVVALERDHLGPDPWSEALVTAGIRRTVPTVRYLVAERGGDVVGHAVVSAAGETAELQRLAVAPDHRRAGVASALLVAATALAHAEGADRLLLEVRKENLGARALYATRGFEELARRHRYYRDGATAVVLALDLGTMGE